MKLIQFFSLIVILSICSCRSNTEIDENNGSYQGYQPFPTGYGYLQDTAALGKAVKAGNTTYVREHAWRLWAGIMQQGKGLDWPVWYTWPTSAQAFAADTSKMQAVNQASIIETRRSLIQTSSDNRLGQIMDTLHLPVYPIPQQVINMFHNDPKIFVGNNTIADGKSFLFNGDIMIPSESLTIEGFDWIRKNKLYRKSTLDSLHNSGTHDLDAPPTYVVTKHMYWPVPAQGISAIPVWNDDYSATYPGYAGYEVWKNVVAVDPSGKSVGKTATVTYLHGVLQPDGKTPMDSITKQAKVYSLNDFYYHKVTKADWSALTDQDKAIINASSYWAYNKPFGVGDYLVTIAMHINTKEVPTWALQSVWWSDTPNAGEYAANRPSIPSAKGPWAHYKLVDAYGIPQKTNPKELPVGMNPYIELVIHPVATNCNNCHRRAGEDSRYQSPQCLDMLSILKPDSPCLRKLLLTDFQWIIPDRAK